MTATEKPRIVVGVDGSDASADALAWAVDEARLRGAVVRVVHAWQYPYMSVTGFPVDERILDAIAEAAHDLLDGAIAAREGAGVEFERELVNGTPAQALLDSSKDADLLVVGSRGRGGFSGLLLGSVSQACVHHATCPVVIIRR